MKCGFLYVFVVPLKAWKQCTTIQMTARLVIFLTALFNVVFLELVTNWEKVFSFIFVFICSDYIILSFTIPVLDASINAKTLMTAVGAARAPLFHALGHFCIFPLGLIVKSVCQTVLWIIGTKDSQTVLCDPNFTRPDADSCWETQILELLAANPEKDGALHYDLCLCHRSSCAFSNMSSRTSQPTHATHADVQYNYISHLFPA